MASFPYNGNIPQPTDLISSSQPQLLQNFGSIQSLIDVNHLDFLNANAGKHNVCEFPAPTTFGGTSAGEVALFSNVSTLGLLEPELVFQKESGSAAPITTIEFTSADYASPGWTRLPSGILLKWGTGTATGNSTINYPTGANIPVFLAVLTVQITTYNTGAGDSNTFVRYTSSSTTQLTVYGSLRTAIGAFTAQYQYLAIGY